MLRSLVETALGVIATALTIAAVLWPTWIERLVGHAPDSGSGAAEWWLAVAFAVTAVVFFVAAHRHRGAVRARPSVTGVEGPA